MQDSAKLLGFSATRQLNFSSSRALSIPLNRELQFNPERDLSFDYSRQLPFGVRGVLFRGYACPVCGASVFVDATSCDECGTVFAASIEVLAPSQPMQSKSQDFREQGDMKPRQPQQQRQPAAQRPAGQKQSLKQAPQQPARRDATTAAAPARKPSTFQCPVCNSSVRVGSASCPKCTVQFVFQSPPPPPEDALVMCPICDLKVSSKTDYCTRCGEPLSPGAIAKHKREMEAMRRNRTQTEPVGYAKVGEPQRMEPTSSTITWEEYLEKKKGGGY